MQRIMFSLERGSDTINNSETLLPSSPKPHCILNWANCTKSSISRKPTKHSDCFLWCHRKISFLSTFKTIDIWLFPWNCINTIKFLSCILVDDIFLKVTCISYSLSKLEYCSFRTMVAMVIPHPCVQHTLITPTTRLYCHLLHLSSLPLS